MSDVAVRFETAGSVLRIVLDRPAAKNALTPDAVRAVVEALERAAGSTFLAEALGPEFLKIFLAIKRQECARFSAEVTELDYGWYLRS